MRARSIYGMSAIGLLIATPALARSRLQGAEQTATLDYKGGDAVVDGADNTLRMTGGCTRLVLRGSGNKIIISLAAKSTIEVVGADNEIRWTAPPKSKPVARVTGADNSIRPISR